MAEAMTRYFMIIGDSYLAGEAMKYGGLVFLGILGLAHARITVPVTNLVLDPSKKTSPYRPHPWRKNLASELVALVLLGKLFGLSDTVVAWLMIAAGAGFFDPAGEGFIGREALRAEIIMLTTLPPVWSRTDLARRRVSRVPVLPADGWHLALMGGIGTAVLAVLSIAGLLHAGLTLPVGCEVKVAIFFRLISVFLRILPELAEISAIASHISASIFWAAGFGLWLWRYYPNFDRPRHA